MIGHEFPYLDTRDLNLDWLLKNMKQLIQDWATYQQTMNQSFSDLNDAFTALQNWVTDYFDNLDVQQEINNKLDAMKTSGELAEIMNPLIATEAGTWLADHITNPSNPPIDTSLSVSNAAADAKVTGDKIRELHEYITVENANILTGTPTAGGYISYLSGNYAANPDWSYYPEFEIEGGYYYYAKNNGAHIAFFDASHEYISGVLVNNGTSNFDFTPPEGAKYMTYSFLTSNGAQYIAKSVYYDEHSTGTKLALDTLKLSLANIEHFVETGKNLFNKFNLIEGYCVDYTNGARIWRNASYCFCPDFIPCEASTTYHFSALCIIAEYDSSLKCVATHNFSATPSGTFTTQATAVFMKIGSSLARAGALQVEKGSVGTSYESFFLKFKYDKGDLVMVRQDGLGNYTNISDAVAGSADGSIIIVYPGTYEESVHAYNKNVHIVGLNRATCILTYSGLNYSTPPLEMAAGSVSNMTIRATDSGTPGDHNAYCVHIDNDNEANNALSFENVDFINEVHQAVGIGLRAHFTLTFDSCRFIAVDQAGLYCHDWETSDTSADKTGQTLIVRNCSIVNDSDTKAPIQLQSQELVDKGVTAVFIGNTVVNKGTAPLITMVLWAGRTLTNTNFMGSSDWVLSDDSALNTLETINKPVTAYTTPTVLLERVTDVSGGYVKIGQVVYVNLSCVAAATHTSTPSIFGGLPKPLNGTAVLAGVRADNGLSSTINGAICAGINNTSLYVDAITTGQKYYITGSYVAE